MYKKIDLICLKIYKFYVIAFFFVIPSEFLFHIDNLDYDFMLNRNL